MVDLHDYSIQISSAYSHVFVAARRYDQSRKTTDCRNDVVWKLRRAGWSVTLIAALFAFAAKDTNNSYVLITYISTPLFWLLDGYYLSQERQYRCLYNLVKNKEEAKIDFDLNADPYNKGRNTWIPSMFSTTLIIFYGTLMMITLIVMFIINK